MSFLKSSGDDARRRAGAKERATGEVSESLLHLQAMLGLKS